MQTTPCKFNLRMGQELDKFLVRESKKPKDNGKLILVNGILRHQGVKLQCEQIHNRDKNAVQNMLYIVNNIFSTGKRPELFTRKKKETVSDDTNNNV